LIPEWLTLREAALVTGLDIADIWEIVDQGGITTRTLADNADRRAALVSRDDLVAAGILDFEPIIEREDRPPSREPLRRPSGLPAPLTSRLAGMAVGAAIMILTASLMNLGGDMTVKRDKATGPCGPSQKGHHCLIGPVEPFPIPSPTVSATASPSPSTSPSLSPSPSTTSSPPPAPDTVTVACSGVSIAPGSAAAVQAALDERPAGTTFCFRAGTYHWNAMVVVPSGTRLIAEPGTVITGDDINPAAIGGYGGENGQHDVTVRGFVVERSTAVSGIRAGWRWLIEGNETRLNHHTGIRGNVGSTVRGNYVHHNGRYGITDGGSGMVVEGNEIAFNNTRRFDPNNDAGGTKFIRTNGMTFRDNHVHDNYGNGVWFDWDNINITIEGNRVHNNEGIGIFYEVSYAGIIRNNTLVGNGVASNESLWSLGQIYLNDSQDVDIYGNVIDVGSENAISLIDVERGDTSTYSANKRTANVSVHDNQIIIRASGGLVGLVGRSAAFSDGNRFDRNIYVVYSQSCNCFYWNRPLTFSGWRSTGNDTAGTLQSGS
jgi:parallel beta-helix repeat protein